jgi:CheY-like chemotaxis protein
MESGMSKVLVIDDSQFMRMQLDNIIRQLGHEVIFAPNAGEGIDLVASASPDCVVLDLLLPDMNGIDVLKALKIKRCQVPVIVHTADIQDSTREECLSLGARAFLNKPPQKNELMKALNQVLGA